MALTSDGDKETSCNCTDKCVIGAINTSCPVCASNMSECTGKEAAPDTTPEPVIEPDGDAEPEEKSNSGLLLVLLVLALAGGGALYWFKFRKNKPQTKGPNDLDDYDYGEDDDDEELEYETEEDIPAELPDAGNPEE